MMFVEKGNLARLGPSELAGLHPALTLLERGQDDAEGGPQGPQRGELWRILAGLCLAFLVGESLWGAWIGQRRRVA